MPVILSVSEESLSVLDGYGRLAKSGLLQNDNYGLRGGTNSASTRYDLTEENQ